MVFNKSVGTLSELYELANKGKVTEVNMTLHYPREPESNDVDLAGLKTGETFFIEAATSRRNYKSAGVIHKPDFGNSIDGVLEGIKKVEELVDSAKNVAHNLGTYGCRVFLDSKPYDERALDNLYAGLREDTYDISHGLLWV